MDLLVARHPEQRAAARGARLEGRKAAAVRLPPVIGHRGAAGRAPENTLAGLRRAKELGCAWVEFDVRLTADGAAVLCHDAHLDRTTNGSGLIAEHTLAATRQLDAGSHFGRGFVGERIPTLGEALRLCAKLGLGADIEVKAEHGREYATAAAVAAALRRPDAGILPVLVSSFLAPALAALRVLAPDVPRGILFRRLPRDWSAIARRLGCAAIGVSHHRLGPRPAAAIHAAGFQLMAYTVNHAARARLLSWWGVTSVFTDVPDIILREGTGGGNNAAALRIGATRTGSPALAQEGTPQ
jgi:glycerophosphoryl diester phosphodiesterase